MNILPDSVHRFFIGDQHELYRLELGNFQEANHQILEQFVAAQDFHEHSHWIAGRWENTYCPITLLPVVRKLFDHVLDFVTNQFEGSFIIPHSVPGMKNDGFWFNQMPPASKTGLHDHEASSFLSGVYYLKVPDNSGNIIFEEGEQVQEVTSREGRMPLFPPSLKHRVTENRSQSDRISLAFNVYSLPL